MDGSFNRLGTKKVARENKSHAQNTQENSNQNNTKNSTKNAEDGIGF
jgi:hypothetical protein